jgi:anti-sigma-K factor RskA
MRNSKLIGAVAVLAVALGLSFVITQAGKSHAIRAQVLAVDAKLQTITFQDEEQGNTRTLPVESGAAQSIAELAPGDKVILTCRGDDDGKLLAVTGIKKA